MEDGALIPPGEDYLRVPKMDPRVESSIRSASLRIYLHDSTDYDACCQVALYGDRGWVHSITGAGFYLAIKQVLEAFRDLGLRTVAGYVCPAHARLMQRICQREGVTLEIGSAGQMDGHALVWVEWIL